ncbi:hypothetical protein [Acidiluteibacter ferrifornacis]|uniref:Uncharacterized protein n=1 Tax=Acidiluteibacter ferrifornacis TaxID=2692424 RepID=A0A6N9NMP1_9FLAO|nr:hypothetical protein [Acidiluteibacter ferrifornacis]NBG67154.1 hypothetical protein [Acidiluteibacter ferrifornacis]
MKWIDTTDIRSWANRRDCQETLPLMVRKLIRATAHSIKNIKFPSGDNVLIGGWDGILEMAEETEYLPLGISLWEFGSNRDIKGKADSDYKKRTENPLGYNPKDSTYIFVTPRLWQNAEEWADEKKAEGKWKDVKVLNAEVLEEWLEVAPTVSAWLAKHIGKYPDGGIQSTDDFWEEWSSGIKFNLNSDILLGGRRKEQEKVFESTIPSSILLIQGFSREESLAFIISCFKNEESKEEDFFSRSIIVDNEEAFRELSIQDTPLILIPRFEDTGIFNRAIQKGHSIFIPLGADSTSNWTNKIKLPQIERDSFVAALMKSGLTKEFAERYSKESARNITILRRQLEFTRTTPEWAMPENVSDLIPALIIGRWDENFESDRNLISNIARISYEEYIKKLSRWLYTPDSPILKIGSTWRLTSPFDVWSNASIHLGKADFEMLSNSVLEVLSEINPAFDLEADKRYMASIYGKTREYSGWVREGVVQSLILTSILGDDLNFNLPVKADVWIDNIIREFLKTDDKLLWKSFESKLPLIAEASPTSFLSAVENLIEIENSPIVALFEEEPGFLTSQSYHTGLLWALEGLAWFPQYLSRASLLLAKLASIDPGGNLSNRPINSLREIFKSWHYQTLSSYEERMQVLSLISEKEPNIAWKILIGMLPDSGGGTAFPTHKTRWRMFNLETEKPITYKEIYDTHSTAVDLLLSIIDKQESKIGILIEESVNLSPHDRDKVLSYVERAISKFNQIEYNAWHSTRELLYHHRSYPDAQWALNAEELDRYEKIYEILLPSDDIINAKWLFDDHWPQLPEGHQHKKESHDDYQKKIDDKRKDILISLYEKFGLEIITKLSGIVKERWILGDISAFVIIKDEDVHALCNQLNEGLTNQYFIQSFINRKTIINGIEWSFKLYEELNSRGFNNSALSALFIPLNQTQQLWDFVESTNENISKEYWRNVHPRFYHISIEEKIYGIEKLLLNKRFISSINISSHFIEELPSNLIIQILEKAGTETSEEQARFDVYRVNKLFESLDNRSDFDINSLINLEWIYLTLLASYGNKRKPKRLHEELANNPAFFMDIIKWIYKPDDESKVPENQNGLTDEQIKNRAKQSFDLLQSWKKIPGIDDSHNIDEDFLRKWIETTRQLAVEYGRLDTVDSYIGKVLAQYPEDENAVWPPSIICSIIENLNSESLNRNFSSATFNKRGSSSRAAYAGGDIEREKAAYFNKLAEKHRNKYLVITSIFENLEKGYELDAKRMDEQAERDRLDY